MTRSDTDISTAASTSASAPASTPPFQPRRVFFEQRAMAYPLAQELYDRFKAAKIPIRMIESHNRVTGIPGGTPQIAYREAKRTLVVGVKVGLELDTCRPSADYEFAMGTSCPGGCQYCYLATTLGRKPYVRVYVNIDEILDSVRHYIEAHLPATTSFEASSTSDPLAVEHLTGNLGRAVTFFGQQEHGLLRLTTKFHLVESLLNLPHNGRTRFRFSVNSEKVITSYEQQTATLYERLAAAIKVARAGYPLGFVIAPLFLYPGWQRDYGKLLDDLHEALALTNPLGDNLTFELIQHRFTKSAKRVILERFPHTQLDLNEEQRMYKWGKYGRGKYVYPKEAARELEQYMRTEITRRFPQATVEYFT